MNSHTQMSDLTQGSTTAHISRLTLPLIIGVISGVLVSIVDTYFVSHLGPDALTAIGYAFPVAMAGVSMAFGLGISAAAIIGRSLGRKDFIKAKRQAFQILVISLLLIVIVSCIGLLFIEQVFMSLGVPKEQLSLVLDYMQPWFIGLVFLVVPIVGTAIVRGYGSTKIQTLIMILAAILNAVLDPLFIFGLGTWDGLGIAGASWASVVARAITFLVMVWFLLYPRSLLSVSRTNASEWFSTSKHLFRLGIPAALVNAIGPIATMIVLKALSELSPHAVAAFTIGARIEALALIPAMALSMGIGPFVSHNHGGGRDDRILEAWMSVLKFCAFLGVLLGLAFAIIPNLFVSMFAVSDDVAELAHSYLQVIGISLVGSSLLPIFASMQSAMSRPTPGLAISVLRYGILYSPGAWLGAYIDGFTGLLVGISAAHLISAAVGLIWGIKSFGSNQALLIPTTHTFKQENCYD